MSEAAPEVVDLEKFRRQKITYLAIDQPHELSLSVLERDVNQLCEAIAKLEQEEAACSE